MADSTLSLTVADLAREVGGYLGFGRTPANWSGWVAATPYVPSTQDTQLAWIMECVNSGLRQFYDPPLSEGMPVSHRWSFLRPEAFLNIFAGITEYDMPDAFGALIGPMNYQPSDNSPYSVAYTGIAQVRALLQRVGYVGKPTCVAIVPKPQDGVVGQRFKAVFGPSPDANYTLGYRYVVQPYALTAQYPYPFGGERHGETIKESCLAIAESRFQDESNGNHKQMFMERLAASISADVRENTPDYLGKNSDRTTVRSRWPSQHDQSNDYVTYEGVVPG